MLIHIGLPDLRGFKMKGRSAPRFVGPRTPSCWFFPCAFPSMYQIAMLLQGVYHTPVRLRPNAQQSAENVGEVKGREAPRTSRNKFHDW